MSCEPKFNENRDAALRRLELLVMPECNVCDDDNLNCNYCDKPKDKDGIDFNTGAWYQSGCSGQWYMNHRAAGEIMAVKIDGRIFTPAA